MKHWIRRTFTLSALVVTTAIAIAGVSEAAPAAPLPVPPQPPAIGLTSPIALVLPENGTEMTYQYKFVWSSELEYEKYVVKFKRPDGTSLKYNVPMEYCAANGTCSVKLETTSVLDTAKDGDVIQWRVIGINGDEKTKSNAATIIANTVDKPELISPANGAQLEVEEDLIWANSSANESYTLIVRDMEGGLVIKRTLPSTSCGEVCTYDPYTGDLLAQQTPYQWFVKAKGINGDKAKSGKQQFITGSWAVDVVN